jgi:hypothetical protein
LHSNDGSGHLAHAGQGWHFSGGEDVFSEFDEFEKELE